MAIQNALTIVQNLCKVRGLPSPTVLLTATDPGTIQMVQLLNEEVAELVQRYEWQQTCYQFSFLTVAQQIQGYIDGNVVAGSSTAGYQEVTFSAPTIGNSPTGLANSATAYTATVVIDGVTKNVSVVGSAAQTFTTLLAEINTDLSGAGTASLSSTVALRITSASTGPNSVVAITDTGANHLFASLTNFSAISTAVAGTAPFIAAAAGFWKITNDTLWDTNRHLPLFGPRRMQDIAMLLAIPITGPFLQYNIWQNQLNIIPTPAAGDTIIGFYQSLNGWTAADNSNTYQFITNDTDVPLLDNQTIYMGLKWRWLEAKGLAYGEEKANYELRVMDMIATNRPRLRKNLSGSAGGFFDPVVIMPAGNWPAQT
jgi:hypothetical protein